MLFNSLDFLLFLPLVLLLYWTVFRERLQMQNMLLLLSSYFFYGCWDTRFLLLLIFSTFLDYYTGIKIFESESNQRRKFWLWLSVGINLGFLGVFKYYNFFAASFADALSMIGFKVNPGTLELVLPVGISFYTFHGLSYVLDLYFRRIQPERNFVNYSVFVSFFPLLVAGPIERATHLLPQIVHKRVLTRDRALDGLRQMLWGFFKKIVVADNCAEFANAIFNHTADYSGSNLLLGALFFTMQIYCDFSGYSDIALGTARLFGIELLRNFSFPYFSRDIAEFWRRWHISLSSWFKDYLYIPLGGSKGGDWMKMRNTFIIFLVSGFWHGANWTFIVWGLLNALFIMPSIMLKTNRHHLDMVAQGRLLPGFRELGSMLLTFCLTMLAWVFFRAESLAHAYQYLSRMLGPDLWSAPNFLHRAGVKETLFYILLLMLTEWVQREKQHALQFSQGKGLKPWLIVAFQSLIFWMIVLWGAYDNKEFIYFQF